MTRVRFRWSLLLLASMIVLMGGSQAAAPRQFPAIVRSLLEPQPAHAQIADQGGNFGSDVPCLEAPDQFATTCFANTLVDDSSNSNSTSPVDSSDTALVRFNTGGKTPLANLGQLGSVYGMAYDDGNVTGVRRLFIGAFAKRMTAYGPAGPGAIYAYNLTSGAVSTFTQLPGATNRHGPSTDYSDAQIGDWVTKSSLGDLEIAPNGRSLYALNLDTRQVERYDIVNGTRLAPLSINFAAISSDPAVQADLRPFALEFRPNDGSSATIVYIGLVDSGERSPNNVAPTAYVVGINIATGAQSIVLSQPLNHTAIANRFSDGANAGATAWHSWTDTGKLSLWAMPILADIQFSRDGMTMMLGFRDRNGDVFLADRDDAWWRVQEQGDVLVYQAVNGSWALQTRSVPVASDFFRDNYVGTSSSTAHVENSMGALATTLAGSSGSPTEQVVTTAITPLQGGTAGANWYNLQPDAYDRQATVEIFPGGDLWKSATLGDLENLCTVAYIGDRVWRDTNGNGVQETGEPGVGGVLVQLLGANGAVVANATTDSSGAYQFAVKPNVAYTLALAASNFAAGKPLFDKIMSPQSRGGNDAADSDADQITRRISVPLQGRDAYNMTFDFGIMPKPLANGEVGDLVWNDVNGNGVQDGAEPGVSGITVRLIDLATAETITSLTASNGGYRFTNVLPGTYVVEFAAPAGISAAPRNAGADDARDSDADASTGWRTAPFDIAADVTNYTLDLGLIMGANVRVAKTGPASAPVGTQASYIITYVNDGPAQANAVVVRDTFPAGLSYVSSNPPASSLAGSVLTWNVGAVAPGAQASITVVFSVDAVAPASGTNQATITTSTTNNNPNDDSSSVTTQFVRPNVWVQKSGPATATVGDQLSYTIAYGNNGSASAASVSIADSLPPELAFVSASPAPASASGQQLMWNVGALAPGAQASIIVVARSAASAASGAVVANTAQVSTPTAGDNPGDNSASPSTTLQRADVRVSKSSPTAFPVASGQQVVYNIDFANAGPAAAANVMLADDVPAQLANVAWACASGCGASGTGNTVALDLGTLAAGATGRVTVTGTAQTGTSREDFTNTAAIGTTTPETDAANNQSSVPGAVWTSDVQIIKLAQAQVAAGDTFTATLAYKNNGPAPASNVVIADTLPAGLALVSASPPPTSQNGQVLAWDAGTLGDGQAGAISLVLRADAASTNNTTAINQSRISTTAPDRDLANNRSDAPTLIVARADLAVVKAGPARASAGDTLLYQLSYRNNGPSLARAAVLSDLLPAELDYVSASPAPASALDGVLTWNLGDLQPNQSGIVSVQMKSRYAQNVPAMIVTNTLKIASLADDPTPANNTSAASTVIETADVSVAKHSPAYIIAGQPFTVTLSYANAGPAAAKNVTLRDLLPNGLSVVASTPPATGPGLRWNLGDLAAGASGSVEIVLQAPTTAISGTTYTNMALIDTPASSDRDPGNDASSTVSTVRPNADLAIVKSGPVAPVRSGSPVAYTLSFRNHGPSQALGVRIEDALPAGFTFGNAVPPPTSYANGVLVWNIGALDAGTSGSITVNGTLLGDTATTTRTNVATIASPATPDPVPANNTSTIDTTVQKPDLSITKTDHVTQARPGDTLAYELVVANNGAAVATVVLLREMPPAGVSVLSSDWTAQSDGSYTLQIGDLAPGQRATRQFVMLLPNPLPANTPNLPNTVLATDDGSAGADPTPGDNSSTDTDAPIAGRVGDMVWYDKDGDGQQDAGEAGLGNLVVRLVDPGTNAVLATTTTDANGSYLFGGLRAGTYAVSLAPESTTVGQLRGYRYTTAPSPLGSIGDGAENLALDIGLNNPGSTDVVLAYVRAERGPGGMVTVSWRTLEEINTARFRLLRGVTNDIGQAAEVAVVAPKGSTGGTYAVADHDAPIRAHYWLVEIERGGRQNSYGPFAQQPPFVAVGGASVPRVYLPLVGR